MNPQALRDHFERMDAELTLLREVCHILDIEIVEVHDSIMVAEEHNETLANLIQQLWLQARRHQPPQSHDLDQTKRDSTTI